MAIDVKGFFVAVGHDIEKVWAAIEGTPAVVQIETIAIEAVASELEMVCDKFLGAETPLDKAVEALINELAAKIVGMLPKSTPTPLTGPASVPDAVVSAASLTQK